MRQKHVFLSSTSKANLVYLRRLLNQGEINGLLCKYVDCINYDCFCSNKKNSIYAIPCHLWKQAKLRKLLKGEKDDPNYELENSFDV